MQIRTCFSNHYHWQGSDQAELCLDHWLLKGVGQLVWSHAAATLKHPNVSHLKTKISSISSACGQGLVRTLAKDEKVIAPYDQPPSPWREKTPWVCEAGFCSNGVSLPPHTILEHSDMDCFHPALSDGEIFLKALNLIL